MGRWPGEEPVDRRPANEPGRRVAAGIAPQEVAESVAVEVAAQGIMISQPRSGDRCGSQQGCPLPASASGRLSEASTISKSRFFIGAIEMKRHGVVLPFRVMDRQRRGELQRNQSSL
jgi:hypothetical protein